MEKKTIYYIIGGIAVLGVGYYLWNKSKKDAEEKSTNESKPVLDEKVVLSDEKKTKITEGIKSNISEAFKNSNSNTTEHKKLTPQELDSKLQTCGKKPSKFALKKNKEAYAKCINDLTSKLKSEGLISFEGLAEINEKNNIREMSFAEQVINREDGRMFAGNVYNN